MVSRFQDFRSLDDEEAWAADSTVDPNAPFDMIPLLVCLLFFLTGAIAIRYLFKYLYNTILFDDDVPSISSMYSITSSVDKREMAYANKGYQPAERCIP